jgi:hypothetical protein
MKNYYKQNKEKWNKYHGETTMCELCNTEVKVFRWKRHTKSMKHLLKQAQKELKPTATLDRIDE